MSAKANILAKLKKSLEGTTPVVDDYNASLVTQPWSYAPEQRIARLRQLMEAVHTEIHLTTDAGWPALLEQLLRPPAAEPADRPDHTVRPALHRPLRRS